MINIKNIILFLISLKSKRKKIIIIIKEILYFIIKKTSTFVDVFFIDNIYQVKISFLYKSTHTTSTQPKNGIKIAKIKAII